MVWPFNKKGGSITKCSGKVYLQVDNALMNKGLFITNHWFFDSPYGSVVLNANLCVIARSFNGRSKRFLLA
jgi:hypothetical protein